MIVPCKNEAGGVEATLNALARQTDLCGNPLPNHSWEVLLLVNNSRDASFARANRFRQAHPEFVLHLAECHFPVAHANIGYVRRLLMDTAAERLCLRPKSFSVIASTDADTEVASDWLAQNIAEIKRGADAVGGRISLHPTDLRKLDKKTKRIHLWDDRYNLLLSWLEDECDPLPHDPWPRHHQHFAASLAVRPDVYRQVGGLPPKEALEDVAFFHALTQHDARFRHSPDVCVHTSGRLQGKAAAGLARQLTQWSEGPSKISVASVDLHKAFFSLRKRLRALWLSNDSGEKAGSNALTAFVADSRLPLRRITEALACRSFGLAWESLHLWHHLERGLFRHHAHQSLEEAVHQLQQEFFATGHRPVTSIEEAQFGIAAP